ncbi:MAG: hypothetical protein HXY38_07695 [Chloroflexi bacterium]|nr:hypothetical protein [Chloroflexota bacterium]
MNRQKEIQLAKAPYNWLTASPLITVATLLFITQFGTVLCDSLNLFCRYEQWTYIIGVLLSALWHLLLLQYVNNKESELVREHGRKALMQAGIRTGVALLGVTLDWALGASGGFACVAIIVLLIIWAVNITQSKHWVEGDNPPVPVIPEAAPSPENKILIQPTQELLDQILTDLHREDDVVVITAINKLEDFSEANEAILNRLEDLANKDDNMDIRMDARIALHRLVKSAPSQFVIGAPVEGNISNAKEKLDKVLSELTSGDNSVVWQAVETAREIEFSSEAIRRRLEILATKSGDKKIRENALAALASPANRAVQKLLNPGKLDRVTRYVILQEIEEWTKNKLIETHIADVLRRRYDFDFDVTPQTPPKPASAQPAVATPKAETPAPAAPPRSQVPPEPRPTLLQTLTSESAIRIYLYLGAFFVIAAAAILGAVVPELRLPILILGTFIFGGLAVAIKKRLPQPGFALFIIFSFLLVITANSLEETMRAAFNLTANFTDAYWVVVFIIMALIWAGSAWLYESRLFSVTAFGSLILAAFRLGGLFEVEFVYYTLLTGFTALMGLAGTWLLKKWKDNKFALPLFFAAQVLQLINLAASLSIFGIDTFNPSSENLLNLVAFATWALAGIFYILSEGLYPFFAFPWLAAATLIPMPWFVTATFDLKSLGAAIVLLVWGSGLAVISEPLVRFEKLKKYGLPVLLASMPSLALALFTGFVHETWLGFIIAAGIAFLFAALHILQPRWWLWGLALLNASIAYFAFFQLDFIKALDVFFGYQLVGITILFLLPDLFLKKDWSLSLPWRLPLRIFGAAFLFAASLLLLTQNKSGHIAANYFVLTLFCTAYALAYRKSYLAYLPAAYLPLAVVYALNAFHFDAWLPALTALAVLYYFAGTVIRKHEKWGNTLRYSGMALGAIFSFAALILTKETGGWYALIAGLLFIAETYLSRNGFFELGAPVLFTLGIFLILRDFDVEQASYHLLAYSLVWLLADLLAHLALTNPRPLSIIVRLIGGMLALTNYAFLFAEQDAWIPVIGFGIYALLFLTISLLYRQPNLLYAFTLTLPLFVTFLFRAFNITKWVHPVIAVAMAYYALGTFLRAMNRVKGWDQSLLYSGLGVGVIASIGALILGGLDASIPVAIAATLWAFEAFAKRNAWLAFPANGLYLLAYFIILFNLNVNEPQFFSVGAALFGLIQHYLLTRAESKTGAFIMGMFSQFVLLGTTYIEMLNKNALGYFFLLFAQSLVILIYGIVIRSRSLTLFPIGFAALGVITVVYSALKNIGTIFVIGCTGILLLMLGIAAVLLRERIAKLGEQFSEWKA